MKKISVIAALLVFLVAAPALALDAFPDLELKADLTPEQAEYLGAGEAPFLVTEIRADYLFIEVFSLYCPICQRNAPDVKVMDAKIREADPEGRIKFIGIGVGNTPFEVAFYSRKFKVDFPLFHDEQFDWHKALGNVGAPAFYLVDLKNGREILFFHEGDFKSIDGMVESVLSAIRN